MKRALAWMAGLVGIAALGRLLSRRTAPATAPEAAVDPAEELRQRLAAQRAAGTAAPDDVAAVPDAPPETLEERRARIHAKAQEAIDSMKAPDA